LEGAALVSLQVLVYVPTLILYLVTYYLRPGKAWLISRILSYTGAFFVLLYVGLTFSDDYFNLNLENHIYWAAGLGVSLILSTVLVGSCYRRYKKEYMQ
jgi:Na+-driven multidrug efflux pump